MCVRLSVCKIIFLKSYRRIVIKFSGNVDMLTKILDNLINIPKLDPDPIKFQIQ